jgi:hypothetical protein
MEEEGVHPGVLSVMRRIRAMPAGKRGFFLFLLQRYAAVLEEELHDPTFKEPGAEVHPFGGARTASAA